MAAVSITRSAARERERQAKLLAEAERKRVEECGRVVLDFANHIGYIARQVISKDELETLIDQGISPEKLGTEINRRIEDADGMIIGHQGVSGGRIDVKLTQDFRDRHVYVIGKSGAGKTTLLRTMIMQDLRMGSGLAVIVPEAEMLHEELLPFIPDDRIGDVIYFNPADQEVPVPFNPLYLDEGEDPDLRIDELLTIFRRILGEPGPRMDEILRQTFGALVARDYGKHLDISWFLTVEPGFFKSAFSAMLAHGNINALSFSLDLFDNQDLRAYVTSVHRCAVKQAVEQVGTELNQDTSKLNWQSKGFLQVW